MSPLAIRYFSQTPYRLGTHEVKFSVRPAVPPSAARAFPLLAAYAPVALPSALVPEDRRPRNTSSATSCSARSRPTTRASTSSSSAAPIPIACRSTTPRSSGASAARPMSRWRRSASRSRPLSAAAIAERLTFSEHLSFTPWHTLAHEPLGSINQARRIVYETISSLRHDMNGKRRREPLPGESPATI